MQKKQEKERKENEEKELVEKNEVSKLKIQLFENEKTMEDMRNTAIEYE